MLIEKFTALSFGMSAKIFVFFLCLSYTFGQYTNNLYGPKSFNDNYKHVSNHKKTITTNKISRSQTQLIPQFRRNIGVEIPYYRRTVGVEIPRSVEDVQPLKYKLHNLPNTPSPQYDEDYLDDEETDQNELEAYPEMSSSEDQQDLPSSSAVKNIKKNQQNGPPNFKSNEQEPSIPENELNENYYNNEEESADYLEPYEDAHEYYEQPENDDYNNKPIEENLYYEDDNEEDPYLDYETPVDYENQPNIEDNKNGPQPNGAIKPKIGRGPHAPPSHEVPKKIVKPPVNNKLGKQRPGSAPVGQPYNSDQSQEDYEVYPNQNPAGPPGNSRPGSPGSVPVGQPYNSNQFQEDYEVYPNQNPAGPPGNNRPGRPGSAPVRQPYNSDQPRDHYPYQNPAKPADNNNNNRPGKIRPQSPNRQPYKSNQPQENYPYGNPARPLDNKRPGKRKPQNHGSASVKQPQNQGSASMKQPYNNDPLQEDFGVYPNQNPTRPLITNGPGKQKPHNPGSASAGQPYNNNQPQEDFGVYSYQDPAEQFDNNNPGKIRPQNQESTSFRQPYNNYQPQEDFGVYSYQDPAEQFDNNNPGQIRPQNQGSGSVRQPHNNYQPQEDFGIYPYENAAGPPDGYNNKQDPSYDDQSQIDLKGFPSQQLSGPPNGYNNNPGGPPDVYNNRPMIQHPGSSPVGQDSYSNGDYPPQRPMGDKPVMYNPSQGYSGPIPTPFISRPVGQQLPQSPVVLQIGPDYYRPLPGSREPGDKYPYNNPQQSVYAKPGPYNPNHRPIGQTEGSPYGHSSINVSPNIPSLGPGLPDPYGAPTRPVNEVQRPFGPQTVAQNPYGYNAGQLYTMQQGPTSSEPGSYNSYRTPQRGRGAPMQQYRTYPEQYSNPVEQSQGPFNHQGQPGYSGQQPYYGAYQQAGRHKPKSPYGPNPSHPQNMPNNLVDPYRSQQQQTPYDSGLSFTIESFTPNMALFKPMIQSTLKPNRNRPIGGGMFKPFIEVNNTPFQNGLLPKGPYRPPVPKRPNMNQVGNKQSLYGNPKKEKHGLFDHIENWIDEAMDLVDDTLDTYEKELDQLEEIFDTIFEPDGEFRRTNSRRQLPRRRKIPRISRRKLREELRRLYSTKH